MRESRQLKQDPSYPFIGKNPHVLKLWAKFVTRLLSSVDGHHIRDIIFETRYRSGTFSDVASINEWFANLARPPDLDWKEYPHSWSRGLLDDAPIVFTHTDLHRSNIMISRSPDGAPTVIGLIDWHQSGWHPAPWEFYKTRYTAKGTTRGVDKWKIDFILEFLHSYRGFSASSSFL